VPRRAIYDPWLFITTGLLVLGGLFIVGSASNYVAMEFGKDPSALLLRQALHLLLGFCALAVTLRIPYSRLRSGWLVAAAFAVCFAGLVVVLALPPIAGAHRWITAGPLRFQPSEMAKLFVVLFMAWELSRKEERVNDLWSVPLPCLAVVGALALLVVIEPDLGSAVVLAMVPCVMLFAAGLSARHALGFGALGAVAFVLAVLAEPYRLQRLVAFTDPWADAHDSGFQLVQSLIAFGNGGVAGVGLGQGQQKALFLPAAHTDFIYSIVGEELGLVGSLMLLLAFVLLYWRGLRTAYGAPDRFGFYLALGLVHLLVLQALLNMAICVGLLPTTGVTLPLISYGGSSLLASMAAMGLLLNVSQRAA
jgi:cell division protein FtsW